jgi:hypothetical protein
MLTNEELLAIIVDNTAFGADILALENPCCPALIEAITNRLFHVEEMVVGAKLISDYVYRTPPIKFCPFCGAPIVIKEKTKNEHPTSRK